MYVVITSSYPWDRGVTKHVTFDETSLLKSIVSQRVERTKTKDVLQQVEVDATPLPPVDSISFKISRM